jgi:hypothetical protein
LNIKISFEGTADERLEIYALFLQRALKQMNEAKSLEEAKSAWLKYPAFQDNMKFIDAKENAKKRLKK